VYGSIKRKKLYTYNEFSVFNGAKVLYEDYVANATINSENIDGFHVNKNLNFSYLPIDLFIKFPNLLRIFASNCAIKKITAKNFKKLKYLSTLKLFNNRIEYIEENSFKDLQSLESLHIDNNKLFHLSPNLFESNILLRTLKSDHNNLTNLSKEIFINLKRLEALHFDYNQITNLSCDISSNFLLRNVSFSRNPINEIDKSIIYLPFFEQIGYIGFKRSNCISECFGSSPYDNQKCLDSKKD
jgi:Leucine-rich repeat (LRR) protein